VINLAAAGCAAVLVCLAPAPLPACWPFLLVSAVVQAGYQVALLQAYRLGDFGQMYPIARGTSPWLVTIVATVLLGQPMPAVELAGVLVISGGLGVLALAGGVPDRSRLPEFAAALGTGVLISAYTVVDGLGVRHSGTPSGYVAWLFLLHSPVLPLLALATRGRALLPRLRPVRVRGLTGGVLSLSAYGIVIWAQSRGALASVAALRETSIVIGALIGALLFRERFGPVRIVASAVVVAGIVLLNLG
jgi:drug/metabolite transporter (DMT)-like permease